MNTFNQRTKTQRKNNKSRNEWPHSFIDHGTRYNNLYNRVILYFIVHVRSIIIIITITLERRTNVIYKVKTLHDSPQ